VRACWVDGAVAAPDRPPDWLPEPVALDPRPGASIAGARSVNPATAAPMVRAGRRLWVEVEP
jgi:hypothetical protein